jgi:hypothetical protein
LDIEQRASHAIISLPAAEPRRYAAIRGQSIT